MEMLKPTKAKRTRITWLPTTEQYVLDKCGGRCAYCGLELDLDTMTVDHIQPRSRGGKNDRDNINPSCSPCNMFKSAFTVEELRCEIENRLARLRKSSSIFRHAERLGLVIILSQKIVFHFEKALAENMDNEVES